MDVRSEGRSAGHYLEGQGRVMGHMVDRPATAFSKDGRRTRRPREKKAGHLAWVKTLPCLTCPNTPATSIMDPAHIRYADPRYAKSMPGMGRKPDDCWTVPLCRGCHDEQGDGERAFWARVGIDPCIIAAMLWIHSGDDEAAELILEHAKL